MGNKVSEEILGENIGMRIVSPLKWHGGKHYLAKKIVALMPPHLHYVEPYAGSLAVLLCRDPEADWIGDDVDSSQRGSSEVVNDIHGELMNFWSILAHTEFAQMRRILEATPFSEETWEFSKGFHNGDALSRAVYFFIRCRQSLAGRCHDFATLSRNRTRRGMNEQASAWLTCVAGLPAVHDRLRRVVLLCRKATDVIRQQDGPKTLFYLDPPYVPDSRAGTGEYEHEMSAEDHSRLLDLLAGISGKFILSGYPSELYDKAEKRFEWRHVDFELPNNAAGGKNKKREVERVWMNY